MRRPYTVLSDAEIAGVMAAAGTARDRALVAVMFGAGLRVSEAVGFDVDHHERYVDHLATAELRASIPALPTGAA